MAARNGDRGGQRQQLRDEVKHLNALLDLLSCGGMEL